MPIDPSVGVLKGITSQGKYRSDGSLSGNTKEMMPSGGDVIGRRRGGSAGRD